MIIGIWLIMMNKSGNASPVLRELSDADPLYKQQQINPSKVLTSFSLDFVSIHICFGSTYTKIG